VLTVFGAGAQARAHVDAVISVRPIETLFIVNRTRSNGEKLAAYASSAHSASGLKRVVVLEAPDQECVRDAQIICTTTNSSKPLFDGKWLNQERGTHVNAVGSYTPAMQEIDVETVGRCVVVVDTQHALACGDLAAARREGGVEEKTHGMIDLGSALSNECSTVEKRAAWLAVLEEDARKWEVSYI
jgi:ornithine cyclodeaminase